MSSNFRFNPHDIDKATIRRLRTGRDAELNAILRIVDSNLAAGGARSHLIVRAPRGFGKSFLMRLTQLELLDRQAAGENVGVALLPEEQMNINAPDLLLREIRRVFLREPPQSVVPQWERSGLWEQARTDLDAALDATFGAGKGLLVAIVENLDMVLAKAFPERVEQATLRHWLNDSSNRIMLLAGSAAGDIDSSPAAPLFRQFTPIELHGWSEADCVSYLGKLMQERQQALTPEREAKARAIATFIGGNPRLSVILGDVLLNDDALTTAELLDKLVDELTPYYQDRIQSLGGRAQSLLDALLRGGEPCSQSALAERVGARQSDIARAFRELQAGRIVVGDRAADGKETLYRVEDRVFAHYYRKRHLLHGQEYSPFEAIAEFLKLYFNNPEKREQAMRLALTGKGREARFLLSLADQEQAPHLWDIRYREGMASDLADRCLTAIGRIEPAWRDLLAQDMDGIGRDRAAAADICTRLSQREIPESLSVWHRLLMAIAHYLARADSRALQDAQTIDAEFQLADDQYGRVTALFFRSGLYAPEAPERVANLQAALQIAEKNADMHGQALVNLGLARTFIRIGQYENAITAASRTVELAGGAAELDADQRRYWLATQAVALSEAAFSLGQLGRHQEAVARAAEAAALAHQINRQDVEAIVLRYAAWSLGRLGRHAEAVERAVEAAALAHQVDQPDEQAIALQHAAWSLLQLGRDEEATATAGKAEAIAAEVCDHSEQAECLRIMAISLYRSGQHETAIKRAREAFALAVPQGDHFVAKHALFWLLQSAAVLKRDDDVRWAAEQWLHLLPQLAENDEARRPARNLRHLAPALLRRNRWADDLPLLRAAWPHFEDWERSGCGHNTAAAAATLAEEQGRAVAYAAVAGCIRALASGGGDGVDFTPFLDDLLGELAAQLTDPGLLTDVAGLLREELPSPYATRAALMEAAALFHASGRDPASLQRVDPDIALAIRRVWMPEPAEAPPSTPKRRTGRKKKG